VRVVAARIEDWGYMENNPNEPLLGDR